MRLAILPAVALAGVLLACSGSSDSPSSESVLHMRGYDMTDAQYRNHVRGGMAVVIPLCETLTGLTAREALDAFLADQEGTPTVDPPPKATLVPGQLPQEASQLRAMEIVLEECDRVAD